MGLFDIHFSQKSKNKNLSSLQNDFYLQGYKTELNSNELQTTHYKTPYSILRYNLNISVQNNDDMIVEGELQHVLFMVIIIAFSILFTYGVGVIILVAYVYYQKIVATKALKKFIDKVEGIDIA